MTVTQGPHFPTLIKNVVGITATAAKAAFVEPKHKSVGDSGVQKFLHKKQTYYVGWKKTSADSYVLETITDNASDASTTTGIWAKYFK